MKKLLLLGLLISSLAHAENIFLPNLKKNVTGTTSTTHNSMDVNVASGSLSVTSTTAGTPGGVLPAQATVVAGTDATLVRILNTDATGKLNINNVSGTVSLPSGAATVAKQPALGTAGTASADVITIQGIASMTALKTDSSATTQPVSGTVTANAGTNLNTSALNLETTQTAMSAKLPATLGAKTTANSMAVNIASDQTVAISAAALPLPALAATSTLQTTGNTSLGNIDTKTPALGQALAAASVPVVLTASQLTTLTPPVTAPKTYINTAGSFVQNAALTTVISETAPATAVGFILEASSSNAANMRWAVGATATTTSGMRLEPGRDSGFVPVGATITVVAESGTLEYQLTWIKQ